MDEKEINDTLAEKAMQWTKEDKHKFLGKEVEAWFVNGKFIRLGENWMPTRNFSQAWQVATKMLKYVNGPGRITIEAGRDIFSCAFKNFAGLTMSTRGFSIDQPTVQMAICLATLDYLGIETEDENGEKETS